jgi:hypothetical protein
MASSYSDLKIELIGTGDQSGTWGTTTNNNLGTALGEAITGSADVSFSSADVTVTLTDTNAAQTARNLRLNLTGTSGGARNLILGSGCQIEKLYLINNGLADTVTVKNTSGTGIAVPAGKTMFVYNNGTNVVDAMTHATSLTLGSALPVASGGTGTSTAFTTGSVVFAGASGTYTQDNANFFWDDTNNRLGIGTSSPTEKLEVYGASPFILINNTDETVGGIKFVDTQAPTTQNAQVAFNSGTNALLFDINNTERMRIDSSGNVVIGTSATINASKTTILGSTSISTSNFLGSQGTLALSSPANSTLNQCGIYMQAYNESNFAMAGSIHVVPVTDFRGNFVSTYMADESGGSYIIDQFVPNSGSIVERMRINSSGNVGIGTTSPEGKLDITSQGANTVRLDSYGSAVGNQLSCRSAQGTIASPTATIANNNLLRILGSGYTGTDFSSSRAEIAMLASENWTAAANGTYITFKTTVDGTTSSAERMRINSSGILLVGKTTADATTVGETIYSGAIVGVRSASILGIFNRLTNDGDLIAFRQDSVTEGTISVSGTTVSYNGGHLSRWSQLPDGSKDDSILKGTVLSNLDEMCVWEKDGVVADNEQLNKMKVSDIEGDTNVAGVFVNWTMDEEYGVDDMNIAMTGDMIIRIADGVVVQKGDLLMSAGDGTAKPQGDDIVRSKTVAKVTSNYVTCTYADGSYCVPCVLMAC